MTEPLFLILSDDDAPVVRVATRGFWAVETVHAYTQALRAAIARMHAREGAVGVIIDASAMPPQAAGIGEEFVKTWREMIAKPRDRAAVVAGSPLAAMQFRRIYQSDRCQVFDTAEKAERWIAEEMKGSAASPAH